MGYSYWTEEEVEILRSNYPTIENTSDLVNLITNKTLAQIKSKAKSMKIKRTYMKNIDVKQAKGLENLKCRVCNITQNYPEKFFMSQDDRNPNIIVNICNSCKNKLTTIYNYKSNYGIKLDINKMLDTYSITQWWKWTFNEKTPNGKSMRFIPREIQTEANVSTLGKYVINEIIGLRTKDEILTLSQKLMEKFKIAFSRTSFILNSPTKLIRLSFPDLEFNNWEMKHSGNNFWKDYDNFLDAVRYYYYNIYQLKFKDICLSKVFSPTFIEKEFYKLHRAKELHFNDKYWEEIMKDIDSSIVVPKSQKEAFDGTILDSIQEKEIYEFFKLSDFGNKFINIPRNSQNFKFHDKENSANYIPDFIILGDKPIIIEYFGCYDTVYDREVYKGYKEKTQRKVKYFNSLREYHFISLYPKDLKNNFKGLKQKLNIA